MTTNDLIRLILEARTFKHLQTILERETKRAAEEAEAVEREWNVDSLGQD